MRRSIYLFLFSFCLYSCSTFTRQSSQITNRAKSRFTDSCETYIFTESLKLLAQNKSKWKNIDFKNEQKMREILKYIQKNVAEIRKGKNYIRVFENNKELLVTDKEFYKVLFNSTIEDKPPTWEILKFLWPYN